MKIVKLFLIGFILIGFSGGAAYCQSGLDPTYSPPRTASITYYEPSADLEIGRTAEFSSTSAVTLINGQPSTQQVLFYSSGYANLNAWTDVAGAIIERELASHGLKVVKGASKTITLSIESAKTDVGWHVARSKITMSAKTSSGYSATYVGGDGSAGGFVANPSRQMDTALVRAIGKLLNDPQMIIFLTD